MKSQEDFRVVTAVEVVMIMIALILIVGGSNWKVGGGVCLLVLANNIEILTWVKSMIREGFRIQSMDEENEDVRRGSL